MGSFGRLQWSYFLGVSLRVGEADQGLDWASYLQRGALFWDRRWLFLQVHFPLIRCRWITEWNVRLLWTSGHWCMLRCILTFRHLAFCLINSYLYYLMIIPLIAEYCPRRNSKKDSQGSGVVSCSCWVLLSLRRSSSNLIFTHFLRTILNTQPKSDTKLTPQFPEMFAHLLLLLSFVTPVL